jgi:aminopeptidase Y
MLGSPNFVSGILNANGTVEAIRNGSTKIQQLHEQYASEQSWPYVMQTITTGSDYHYFILNGVPSGGMASGIAKDKKTVEEREVFGGLVGEQYDPCYHTACDDVPNINSTCLERASRMASFVLQTLWEKEDLAEYIK